MLLQQLHRRRQQLSNNGGSTVIREGSLILIDFLPAQNGGSSAEDWSEGGINRTNNGEDEKMSFLANRRFRWVIKYEGSSGELGDVQLTNVLFQSANQNNNGTVLSISHPFTQTTDYSSVSTGNGTDEDDYLAQSWTNISTYTGSNTSVEGQFNELNTRTLDSPTANTGRLNTPLQYADNYYAETSGNGNGSVIWMRTGIQTFVPFEGTIDYERFVLSVGQDGANCGRIEWYVYLEPETNGTLSYPTDSTAPATPTLAGATITNDTATITWSAVSDSDLREYIVTYRYRVNSGSAFGDWTFIRNASGTSMDVDLTELDSYGDYEFGIQAIDTSLNVSGRGTTSTTTYSASQVAPVISVVSESFTSTVGVLWQIDIRLEIGEFYDSTLSNNLTPNQLTSPDTFAIYYELQGGTPTISSNQVPDSWIQYQSTPLNWRIQTPSGQFATNSSFKYIVVATNSAGTTTSPVRTLT